MAIVTKNYDLTKILQGAPNLFLGVKAPPSAVPPVEGTNDLTLDANGEPSDAGTLGELATLTVVAGGTGYAVGDIFSITQAGASGGKGVVTGVNVGVVTTAAVLSPGDSYSAAAGLPTVHLTGAGNDALTVTTTITAGEHMGSVLAPAELTITTKTDAIGADQIGAPIGRASIAMEAEIDCTLQELSFQKFARLMPALGIATYYNLPLGATNPAADFLQIGAPRSSGVKHRTVTLVSPRRDAAGKFNYVMLYRALQVNGIEMDLTRGKATNVKLKFRGHLDTSRTAGDMMLQTTFPL